MLKRRRSDNAETAILAGGVFGFASICFAIYMGFIALIALWTDRNLDFWVSHIKGEDVNVPYWLSFLVSLFAPATIVGNILAEIARFFV